LNDMNEKSNSYDEYEIDLREYILLIWKKKYLLVGLVIAAMVLAVIFTNITEDPQYKASSTLLIMPPMYTTSIEVGSLPVETYRELALTSQMRNKIIEKLDLRDDEGELISQTALENRMEFEIAGREEIRREGESVEAPLIKLNVIHRDAEIAADIANAWAELFMEDTREVRRAETTEISNLIETRFENTRERLTDVREKLKEFVTENNIERLEMNLNAEKEQLEKVFEEKAILEYDTSLLKSELGEIEKQLDEFNIDGAWSGELSAEILNQEDISRSIRRYLEAQDKLLEHRQNYDFDLLSELLRLEEEAVLLTEELNESEHYLKDLDDGERWIGELDLVDDWDELPDAIKRYSNSRNKLLDHRQEYNFNLMEKEIGRLEGKILNYRGQLEEIERELVITSNLEETVSNLLVEEPEKWELYRSPVEEAIWQELFNAEELEAISSIVLSEEIINPLYKELRNMKQDAQIDLETLEVELVEIKEDYETAIEELESLQFELNQQEEVRDRLVKDRDNYYEKYNSFVDRYLEQTEIVEEKEMELKLNRAQVRALRLDLEDLFAEVDYEAYNVEELRNIISSEKLRRERLEDDKEHYKEIYNQEAEFYSSLEEDYRELKSKLRQKEVRLATVDTEKDKISENVAELDHELRELQIVEEDLKQQISDLQVSYEQLASRVEEARLAEAEQTSDVKFIADAMPPDRASIGIGNTMLNMAVAAVLAGMLGVFGIFFAEFIKED